MIPRERDGKKHSNESNKGKMQLEKLSVKKDEEKNIYGKNRSLGGTIDQAKDTNFTDLILSTEVNINSRRKT